MICRSTLEDNYKHKLYEIVGRECVTNSLGVVQNVCFVSLESHDI